MTPTRDACFSRRMKRSRDALISARVARGLTPAEVAADIGMQPRTVNNAEEGGPLRMTTARKFCHYYEKPLTELFSDWAQSGGRWHRNGTS